MWLLDSLKCILNIKELYISKEVQEILPKELVKDLNKNWTKETDEIYSFDYFKWYGHFEDVKAWEDFLNSLEYKGFSNYDWDFIVVGEDCKINEEVPRTYTKFGVSMKITTLNI